MYSYPIMHSTTFPNANIFSKEKPRTRNIHTYVPLYTYIFFFLPPIESSTTIPNYQLPNKPRTFTNKKRTKETRSSDRAIHL